MSCLHLLSKKQSATSFGSLPPSGVAATSPQKEPQLNLNSTTHNHITSTNPWCPTFSIAWTPNSSTLQGSLWQFRILLATLNGTSGDGLPARAAYIEKQGEAIFKFVVSCPCWGSHQPSAISHQPRLSATKTRRSHSKKKVADDEHAPKLDPEVVYFSPTAFF